MAKTSLYDYKLIHSRYQSLKNAGDSGDVTLMIYLLRSGDIFTDHFKSNELDHSVVLFVLLSRNCVKKAC